MTRAALPPAKVDDCTRISVRRAGLLFYGEAHKGGYRWRVTRAGWWALLFSRWRRGTLDEMCAVYEDAATGRWT